MYEYPQGLIDYLTEQESEGAEIFTTQSEDAACWIVKPANLPDWYVVISWYVDDSEYSMINITGKALKRLKLCFAEDCKRALENI